MGQVDLDFKPSAPVFDACVALGRRHDRTVAVDTVEGTLEAMGRAGVGRALAYSPHAAFFDSEDGNRLLMEMIAGEPSLVPQFVCNPARDDLNAFATEVAEHGVRAVRMAPMLHGYPFQEWVVRSWLDWLEETRVPLWLPASYESHGSTVDIDPSQVYETLSGRPNLKAVLSGVHYRHVSWAAPLLRGVPSLSGDLSWLYNTGGIPEFVDAIGAGRVLYGSRFPEAPMAPALYYLHRCGLSEAALTAICSGNLVELLGME